MLVFVSFNAFAAIVLFIYFQNKNLDKYTTHTPFSTHSDLKSIVWLLQQFLTVVPLSPVPRSLFPIKSVSFIYNRLQSLPVKRC